MLEATKSSGKGERGKDSQELWVGTPFNGVVRTSLTEKAELPHMIFCDPSFLTMLCLYVVTQMKNSFSGITKKLRISIPYYL